MSEPAAPSPASSPLERVQGWLWAERDEHALPPWRRFALLGLRYVYALLRELGSGALTMRAQSLVYTTLLSLVPLLAVSFAVLKGLGVHNQLEPALIGLLEPMGERGREVAGNIVVFVENMKVGTLGAVGLMVLFYTVVAVMQKIESAFNYFWQVGQRRSVAQRLSTYVSALVLGPVLAFSAIGLSAAVFASSAMQSVTALPGLSLLAEHVGRLVPFLMLTAAFAFLYFLMPNTRVRWWAALAGALVAALLWQGAGWLFSHFVSGSHKYALIYSAFATAIVFILWLFAAWMIVLVGSTVAFYVQHPEELNSPEHRPRLGMQDTERLALTTLALIGAAFARGQPAWSSPALASRLGVPEQLLLDLLEALEQAGLLSRTAAQPPGFLPARAPENISTAEVLRVLRQPGAGGTHFPLPASPPGINALCARLDAAREQALEASSLCDLAREAEGGTAAPEPPRTAPRAP